MLTARPAAQGDADADAAPDAGADPDPSGRTTPEWAHGRVNPTTCVRPPAEDAVP
jgi:hypothetical protein